MKKIAFVILVALCIGACSSGASDSTESSEGQEALEKAMKDGEAKEVHGSQISEADIKLTNPLNQGMITSGQSIYDTKCSACHKLTDEKLVGPGWKDVTKRRQPAWIMNMITNVEMMLEKDPEAQKMLEQCLVRMPNQNVTQADARNLLEFMRQNDGEK
uniref:C-type cytochrome n=1 Tax=Xanthocytophaga flava TaxID=3048013 RepID=A0ABT7CJ50_9BACT|nr:c-type cytochrome [Xanthocytophaga flavus]MDJ1493025.1 c-type cytochrome [Xanthocytophaga flavus]